MRLALLARARTPGRWLAQRLVGPALVLATVMASSAAEAQPPAGASEPRRHHLGVQLGVFNPSTEVVELGDLGFRLEWSDGQTVLRYRYSLNPRIDLVAELRYWTGRGPTATSGKGKVSGGFIGPGIRVHPSKAGRALPYLQGNLYYAQEMLGAPGVLYEHGIGFGLSGGVDLEWTGLISIPIEATYVASGGGGLDDLSGFGLSMGINFSF